MKFVCVTVMVLCLAGVLGCDGIVTGDYPIVVVDDTITLFVHPDDDYSALLTKTFTSVRVNRPYGDDATIEYADTFNDIKHVHVVDLPGPGDNGL